MILHNCRVLTMDGRMPHGSALAIAGGKVIGGVDSREDAIASHAHERVDLQGATVIPGLVDAHVHFLGWARAQQRAQLVDARSLDELIAAVERHKSTLDGGSWLVGRGWRDELLRSREASQALEVATAGHPALLISKDGHAAWANESALQTTGLSADTLTMDGGLVEDFGVARERSAWTLMDAVPEADVTTAMFAKAMRAANARGVTAVHDVDGAEGFRNWRQLERERGLSLRVWQHFLADEVEHVAALGIDPNFGTSHLRVGGIKAFADGTLGSGTAWLHDPERSSNGSASRTAVPIMDRDALTELAQRAGEARLPLLVHAIGDAAATAVIDAMVTTKELWSASSLAPRIEHAQLMRSEDIARCADHGIALSVQPTHLLTDRNTADERWGDRAERAYAYRSMVDAGAMVLLGSDAPIEDLDPLAAIRAAVLRAAPGDNPWHPEQALTPEQAVACSTSVVADATGVTGQFGRLTPGHAADCVVLSGDPTTDPLENIEIVATMVDGRWVHGRANLGTS
jgi:predicted amidohydrolase YtcJ